MYIQYGSIGGSYKQYTAVKKDFDQLEYRKRVIK